MTDVLDTLDVTLSHTRGETDTAAHRADHR